jgi:hypothetical protein
MKILKGMFYDNIKEGYRDNLNDKIFDLPLSEKDKFNLNFRDEYFPNLVINTFNFYRDTEGFNYIFISGEDTIDTFNADGKDSVNYFPSAVRNKKYTYCNLVGFFKNGSSSYPAITVGKKKFDWNF